MLFVRAILAAVVLAMGYTAGTRAAERISEENAHAIGVQAYLYLYSLVTMDLTRKQLTNIERPEGIHAPMNAFANVAAYPTAEMKVVVRPNFDTLYSSAWLDLTKEPMIISAPNTDGRYYMLPMLDMWTDVFASPGWRTTGTEAQSWSSRRDGPARCLRASGGSTPRHPMCGLSAAPRLTVPPTTMRSTRFRQAIKSRRFPAGASLPSPSPARATRRLIW